MNVVSNHAAHSQTALPSRNRPEPASSHHFAVARAISTLRQSSEGTISLTDLSNVVGLSRFHFNRVFHRIVGIPPFQFQSLLRLDAARRLLLTTSRSVLDISLDIGYESLGTFTRRFAELLGLPPLRLRNAARRVSATRAQFSMVPLARQATYSAIQGRLTAPVDFQRGIIFVGLFHSPVPQGYPARCCVLNEAGPFCLIDVEDGAYYLMAAAFTEDAGPAQRLLHENILRGAAKPSPLVIRNGEIISGSLDVELRPPHAFDPPILTALLPLMEDRRPRELRSSAIGEKTTELSIPPNRQSATSWGRCS